MKLSMLERRGWETLSGYLIKLKFPKTITYEKLRASPLCSYSLTVGGRYGCMWAMTVAELISGFQLLF